VIFFEVPSTKPGSTDTICLYGHLDKQPEFNGWRSDLGPWTPKYERGLLYGRGGADDGYAVYAAISAILALDRQGIPRPRCVGIIESCEESGSFDLPAYIDALKDRLGDVGLVVCLDSGAGNYDQLWLTTSLRGMASGTLKVEVLTEGVHSGDASGLVPSSFRILRQVLDRSRIRRPAACCRRASTARSRPTASSRRERPRRSSATRSGSAFPWACGADGTATLPTTTDPLEALLNRTWKPTLSVTGADGFPAMKDAGNVLRPYTTFKLSLRLPPLVEGHEAAVALKTLLEDNAPYNARVTFQPDGRVGALGATGWNAPTLAPWLEDALQAASQAHYGAPCGYIGQGGTIPLMSMLQKSFPAAQMMVCGVLGPKSNAHGPNEFLHVPYAKKLTAAVAQVMAACA
jgi:acetylornithine deacetylase/succinyl-diaminopimelate desuccinylase-like protein